MKIEIFRHTYNTNPNRNIIGDLFVDGEFFCYTLEDELRADGVKVKAETAIEAGEYEFEVTYSPRFKRDMILIKDVPRFEGIRIHGGNDEGDTEGCPLVAYNTDYNRIWGTAEKELTRRAKEAGGKGTINIFNTPLSYDVENYLPPKYLRDDV